MKKTLIAIVMSLVMVGVMAGPVLAATQKMSLNQLGVDPDPGSGFVVFSNNSGPNNMNVQMSLKGALPNTDYVVYCALEGDSDVPLATITTNAKGNANFHYSVYVPSNKKPRGLGLTRDGVWKFGTGWVIGLPFKYK